MEVLANSLKRLCEVEFFVGRSQGFTDPSDRGADCQVATLEFLFLLLKDYAWLQW